MGINYNMGFRQILRGKKDWRELSDKAFLMLGKQVVNFNCGKLKELLNRIGFEYRKDIVDIDDYDNKNDSIDSYDLFRLLGFKEVDALDISDYEGADIIFDLAAPCLPEGLENRFDYIYDGGVLEHIFNAPQALLNISRMVKIGGKVIHDVCGGNWIDHGVYSFSPTFFIDYYTNNGFFINDIYMTGYQYPEFKKRNVVSPDCRYGDCNEWANMFAKGYPLILTCDAVKLDDEVNTKGNLSFTQYSYQSLFHLLENRIYSYGYKIKRAREIYQADAECKIAICGTGVTANRMMSDLSGMIQNIVGVYDRKVKPKEIISFDAGDKEVLDIRNIHEDGIKYILCGSEIPEVIDSIRQRIKYLKREGVEII